MPTTTTNFFLFPSVRCHLNVGTRRRRRCLDCSFFVSFTSDFLKVSVYTIVDTSLAGGKKEKRRRWTRNAGNEKVAVKNSGV